MNWIGWPMERSILLVVGLLFLGIFVQVTMYHYRQNFRAPSMWVPVIATPLFGVLTLMLAWVRMPGLASLLMPLLWVGVFAGAYGFAVHFQGVGERVNGYVGYNFLVGPPVVLPLTISLVSILGLLALRGV